MKKIIKSILLLSTLILTGCGEASSVTQNSSLTTDSVATDSSTSSSLAIEDATDLSGAYTFIIKNKAGSSISEVNVTLTYGETKKTVATNKKGQATFTELKDVPYTVSITNCPEHFFVKEENIPAFDKDIEKKTIYLSSELADEDEFEEGETIYGKGSVLCDFSTDCVYSENDTLKTEKFTLSESLKTHKAVIINVWASWCGPCKNEMPHFETLMKEYGDKVDLVAIDYDPSETQQTVLDFKEENGYTFKMSADNKAVATAVLGTSTGIPVTAIVDQDGFVAYWASGSITSYSKWKELIADYID